MNLTSLSIRCILIMQWTQWTLWIGYLILLSIRLLCNGLHT